MTTCDIDNLTLAVAPSSRHAAVIAGLSPRHRTLIEEALTVPLTYIHNDFFTDPAAARALFEEGLEIAPASIDWYHPMLEAELATPLTPRSALLNLEKEKHLFLRYNYARYRAARALTRFRTHASRASAQSIALWYGRVKDTRDLLTRANLALVLAMAKRTRGSQVDLGDLISEGNLALLRAIDGFDVARGFKFSTYACRAILQSFGRLIMKVGRYRATFPAEYDPAMERSDSQDTRRAETQQDMIGELLRILHDNRAQLSPLEQTVLQNRFALHGAPQGASDAPAMTLEEVGHIVGLTKERIRQIQNKALAKLRTILKNETL